MKYTTFILLFIAAQFLNAQENNDTTSYRTKGIYMEFYNDDGEKVHRKPIGKNAYISIDNFFKNYIIIFTGENGDTESMDFKHIIDLENGILKMKDKYGTIVFIKDSLKKKNKLLIVSSKKAGDYNFSIVVE